MTTQSPSRDGATDTRTPSTGVASQNRRRLVLPGLAAAVAAAAATTLVAVLAKATVVDFEVPAGEGESIPAYAFAQLTLSFSLIGLALAAALRRWNSRPATVFVRIAVTLTAISLVPPFLLDADLSTSVALVVTHLVAAAIVIPVLALRLTD